MNSFEFLESKEQWVEAFPVVHLLRPHLELESYLALVGEQSRNENYHLLAARHHGKIVAIAGFRIATALAHGRHIYVDDLVTEEAARSRGFGACLLERIAKFGREHGCQSLHLDSGVQRHGAHRFYLLNRMDIVYFHFRKEL